MEEIADSQNISIKADYRRKNNDRNYNNKHYLWNIDCFKHYQRSKEEMRRFGNKYHNSKCIVDGIVFDSRKEARRYQELILLQRAKEISDLQRQVEFTLIPTQREASTETYKKGEKKGQPKEGKVIERECKYIADFVYIDNRTGERVVEDTKGFRTKEYLIKRKLMLYLFGVRIHEI